MNIQNHLIAAAAALVMTSATFASIGGYAQHVSVASQIEAPMQTAANVQAQPQYEVRNDVVDNAPAADADLPTVLVIGHRAA